jgi:hypothetical protein
MISFGFGIIGVALFVILAPLMQFIARRAGLSIAPVGILALAAVISHLVSVLSGIATIENFRYWNATSVFGFGVMSYVFAFGAVYKSVSLEILDSLTRQPERTVPLPDIVDRQIPDIFRERTEILLSGGLVTRIGPCFETTAAGGKLARRIAQIRRTFGIGDSGLYDFAAPKSRSQKADKS